MYLWQCKVYSLKYTSINNLKYTTVGYIRQPPYNKNRIKIEHDVGLEDK